MILHVESQFIYIKKYIYIYSWCQTTLSFKDQLVLWADSGLCQDDVRSPLSSPLHTVEEERV